MCRCSDLWTYVRLVPMWVTWSGCCARDQTEAEMQLAAVVSERSDGGWNVTLTDDSGAAQALRTPPASMPTSLPVATLTPPPRTVCLCAAGNAHDVSFDEFDWRLNAPLLTVRGATARRTCRGCLPLTVARVVCRAAGPCFGLGRGAPLAADRHHARGLPPPARRRCAPGGAWRWSWCWCCLTPTPVPPPSTADLLTAHLHL